MLNKDVKYIKGLDSLRFLAAAAVVIFHFGVWSWPFDGAILFSYFSIANLGVSFFFVLSGFIMYYVYKNVGMKRKEVKRFFIARATRIIPLYVVALLITVLVSSYIEKQSLDIGLFISHLFFFQVWVPGDVLTLNFVNWSLSIEMLFYLLFPLLIIFLKKSPKYFVYVSGASWLVTSIITLILSISFDQGNIMINEFTKFFPLFHLNSFLVGMSAAYLYFKGDRINKLIPKAFMLSLIFLIIYPLVLPGYMEIGHHNGLLAPLFSIIILYVVMSDNFINRILETKVLSTLGKASYGVYLLQAPIYWIVYELYIRFGVYDLLGESFRFYLYLIMLFIISILSYYFFEKKVMIYLRKKIS